MSCAGPPGAVGGGVGGLETRDVLGQRPHHHHHRRAARAVSPLRPGHARGAAVLDQVGVIAARAAEGSDEHYAQLAAVATVHQLRTAVKLEPRPDPEPRPEPARSITTTATEVSTSWRITLPHEEAALFDAALKSHHDALIADWKADHDTGGTEQSPPLPNTVDGFLRLIEAGWDAEATRRPHGAHTTVVVHLDIERRAAALHLGPLLTDAERRYLTCDATCEVWFERHGQPIGAGAAPAPSAGGFAAPWNTATRPARCPAAGPPAVCTPTTSGTGRTAGPPSWPTWCWSALPPPGPSPRPDHHHRPRRRSRSHRHRGAPTQHPIPGPPTQRPRTPSRALPRPHRRTRRLVVVPTLPTTTTTER